MSNHLAAYDLNDYLLNGTEVGPLLGWPNATCLRPILPMQQQPEANDRTKDSPYMVYSFRTVNGFDDWWTNTEELTYVIWGKSFDDLATIANEIIENMRALDETAQDLNDYLAARGTHVHRLYHYVRLVASTSPDPAGQEAGRLGWIITLRYDYSPVDGKYLG